MNNVFVYPNHTGPTYAVDIDEELCIGCYNCAGICRVQTILPNPEKGKPPIVAYPDECWYCGCCVESCPTGALQMRLPINQRILFKDKESGEIFRIGADDAPEKSFFKAPFGYLDHPEFGRIMKELEKADNKVCITLPPDAGTNIGRFFGEKEKKDNTEKLVRFLKQVGFAEAVVSGEEIRVETEEGSTVLSVSALAALLKRLCVSNYTAVHIWQSI